MNAPRNLPERQMAVFELEAVADDKVTRRRWNGGPHSSAEATVAMRAGVEAFRDALAAHGYENVSVSYGVRAEDYPQ